MSFTPYATPADLATWVGGDEANPPADYARRLRAATFVIAEACNLNPYAAALTPDQVQPLNDATCAQAASWIANGVPIDALPAGGQVPVKKTTMLGADVEYDTTKTTAEGRSLAGAQLAPEAETILTATELLWVPLPISGGGELPDWGLGVAWETPWPDTDWPLPDWPAP